MAARKTTAKKTTAKKTTAKKTAVPAQQTSGGTQAKPLSPTTPGVAPL